jgi:uncharacterized protein YeaO (DUF488 family)
MIKIKRIYEERSKDDGYRILIDRLWPRGITNEEAEVDLWLRDISPSAELRKWFSHDPKKWNTFRKKYELELKSNPLAVETVKRLRKEKGVITFLYSAKNEEYNNAIVLAELFRK